MSNKKFEDYFKVPKMKHTTKISDLSEDEITRLYLEVENAPDKDWRAWAEDYENNPDRIVILDADITLPEFIKRIKNGFYD